LPRPAKITVEILPAIVASNAERSDCASSELRERAREAILRELGEPDLARTSADRATAAA
jgi:hypothetical protein